MTTDEDASPDVPDWEDEYIDRVSDRLFHNYDLEKDFEAGGARFDLYGEMRIRSQKHFFHPAVRIGYQESTEHLFARRDGAIAVRDLERYVDLGGELASAWIEPDEEHFSTAFTFVSIVDAIPDDVREFVSGFRDRTLLKFGYNGHYEIHLIVVTPEREDVVASRSADVWRAFALWEPIDGNRRKGILGRLLP